LGALFIPAPPFTFPKREAWSGGNDAALQLNNGAFSDASRIAMLIDHIGRLETQEPFAVLIDDLLLPSLDGRVTGSLRPGVSAACGMHWRAAAAMTVGVTPTAFGAPPAAISLIFFRGSPIGVTALRFAVAPDAAFVSHVTQVPMAPMVTSDVMLTPQIGIFPISHPLISMPPLTTIIPAKDLGLCGAGEHNQYN
jgi:hypothetical protein